MLVPSIQTELSTICVSLKYSTLQENGGEFSERYLFVLSPTYKGYQYHLLEKLFYFEKVAVSTLRSLQLGQNICSSNSRIAYDTLLTKGCVIS